MPAPLIASSRWEVGTNPDSCSMARGYADETALLTLRSTPTEPWLELTIASKFWPRKLYGDVDAKIEVPGDDGHIDRTASIDRLNQGKIGIADIRGLDELLIRRLSDGADLTIRLAGEKPIAFRLTDLAPAFRALHKCKDALMRSWGIDPMAFYRLKQLPKPLGQKWNWLNSNDYPVVALEQNRGGRAMFLFTVQTDGRVRDCRTIISTGSGDLDRKACLLVTRRARYRPATDEDGKPVEAPQIEAVRWVP